MLEFVPFETDEDFLLPEGEYKFFVKDAIEHLGESGKLSIKITVVLDHQQKEHTLFDYLTPNFAPKLKHFCDGTGLADVYQTGKLEPQMCIGRHGVCKVKREAATGRYDAKNSIKDYCKPSVSEAASTPADPDFDKDILF